MAKDLGLVLLLDCYGDLLTPHQRQMMELYYGEDLSLGEIAQVVGITRQGVHDSIKRGKQALSEMEEKLQYAARFRALRDNYAALSQTIDALAAQTKALPEAQALCQKARAQIQAGKERL